MTTNERAEHESDDPHIAAELTSCVEAEVSKESGKSEKSRSTKFHLPASADEDKEMAVEPSSADEDDIPSSNDESSKGSDEESDVPPKDPSECQTLTERESELYLVVTRGREVHTSTGEGT